MTAQYGGRSFLGPVGLRIDPSIPCNVLWCSTIEATSVMNHDLLTESLTCLIFPSAFSYWFCHVSVLPNSRCTWNSPKITQTKWQRRQNKQFSTFPCHMMHTEIEELSWKDRGHTLATAFSFSFKWMYQSRYALGITVWVKFYMLAGRKVDWRQESVDSKQ